MNPFGLFSLILLFTAVSPAYGKEPPEKDRKAILAMAGEFEVYFNFAETVPLTEGYTIRKPYQAEATEMVFVIADSGSRIVLQHILVTGNGKRIVKHWKQIWTWQDTRLTEFQGRQKWKIRQLPIEKVAETWTQQVTQVDDSPRYESFGKWKHDGNFARWESRATNRPLPRREHTKRSDYEVMVSVNRHSLTPHGWVHGQDNLKRVLKENGKISHYLARERGLNNYDRTEDRDFSAAEEYWSVTQEFWGKVSAFWQKIEAERESFEIEKKIDEKSLVETLFEVAADIKDSGREIPGDDEVETMILPYVK